MSTSTISIAQRRTQVLARIADYVELTKPRISILVLVTVAVAAYVARWGQIELTTLTCTLVGTLFVAASASALNQWLERSLDAKMPRTENRPLPARRLQPGEVALFAGISVLLGTLILAVGTSWQAALLGVLTWVLYVCVYTPLKVRTAMNTAIGAIAGAMPVLIGWSASGAALDLRCAVVFTIVFLWQFPHFMAIAWIYREQYARSGMKMLSVVDPTGRRAGVQAVLAAMALIPVSVLPGLLSPSSSLYLVAAFVLGTIQLFYAVRFLFRLDRDAARLLLRATLVYLPALLAFLMLLPFV